VIIWLNQEKIRIPQGHADSCTEENKWIIVCIFLFKIIMTFADACEEEAEIMKSLEKLQRGINLRQRVQ
jgi:hypothetical protein